jgi:hypothetical protein
LVQGFLGSRVPGFRGSRVPGSRVQFKVQVRSA